MRSVDLRRALACLAVLCGTAAVPATSSAAGGVQPSAVDLALDPGESAVVDKVVLTEALPPKADFLLLADNTGSMEPALDDVEAGAQSIVDAIEGAGASDARYAVANYRDFHSDGGCGYGYEEDTDLTDAASAKAAIASWEASGGCDIPEANLFALHTGAAHATSWRPDAERFIVWIGDAPGHDPVCAAVSGHDHDVTEASVTQDLLDEGIRVIAASATSGPGLDADPKALDFGDYGAACGAEQGAAGQAQRITSATGGINFPSVAPGDMAEAIIDAIEALPAIPVEVTPVAACDSGLSATSAPASRVVPSGSPAEFQETIAVEAGVPLGSTLTCAVDFLVNGSPAGSAYVQEVRVRVGEGVPAALELTPESATNPVDTEHCVAAAVRDGFGDPVPAGVPVAFAVSGTNTDGGTAATDSSGTAPFCYDVGPFAGSDTITATAQEGAEPSDSATKQIVLPGSTQGCKVTWGGRITAANGDKATFGGVARVLLAGPLGQSEYQDHGPAAAMDVKSTIVDAVVCRDDGTSTVWGHATKDGAGSVPYRIDLADNGEPGTADTYRMRLQPGYDSGTQTLRGGNVQLH